MPWYRFTVRRVKPVLTLVEVTARSRAEALDRARVIFGTDAHDPHAYEVKRHPEGGGDVRV